MNRRTVVLSAVLAVVAGVGAYKYYEHIELERAAQAQLAATIAAHRAAEARKKAEAVSAAERGKLVLEARRWLDRRENLAQARANLQKVIKAAPRDVAARIEMARYIMLAGYISYRNYQPGVPEAAIDQLASALVIDPDSVPALVMIAFVHQRRGSPWQAISALEKAEKVGGDTNPWLYLYWADALMDLNRLAPAQAKLERVEALLAAKPSAGTEAALHERYSSLYTAMGRLDDADKHYQAQLALIPQSAFAHGNYSLFLLFERGQPDAAIREAENALRIRDYGMARRALAAARYAKWAQLKRKDPARAAELLAAAKADTPDFTWIMPQAGCYVGSSPVMHSMVAELVALGVPLDTKDEHGDTGMTLAAYSGKQRSVEILAKMGASLETRDNNGRTAFNLAARLGHMETARALRARGAQVNTQDAAGQSALHGALFVDNEAMVRTLLAMKVDVNLADASGQTALMLAAINGNAAIAQLLLAAGADPSAVNAAGKRTAADLAEAGGYKDLAETLRRVAKK